MLGKRNTRSTINGCLDLLPGDLRVVIKKPGNRFPAIKPRGDRIDGQPRARDARRATHDFRVGQDERF